MESGAALGGRRDDGGGKRRYLVDSKGYRVASLRIASAWGAAHGRSRCGMPPAASPGIGGSR